MRKSKLIKSEPVIGPGVTLANGKYRVKRRELSTGLGKVMRMGKRLHDAKFFLSF